MRAFEKDPFGVVAPERLLWVGWGGVPFGVVAPGETPSVWWHRETSSAGTPPVPWPPVGWRCHVSWM
jgi:hypothetical protein